mmetsp:Transcript_22808/g.49321  ORF Transcript_22808/g.49321 Transcript_22808/m.49321 type:complete len:213 (+) Transcript_22808:632-1270(+)
MVRDPVLRVIVRPYPLAPIPPTHQRTPCRTPLFQLLLLPPLVHPRRHEPQRFRLVLVLRSLLLHVRHNPRRDVGHPHRAIRRVDVLTSRPGRAHGVNPQFRRGQRRRNLILGDRGKDRHGDGRGLHLDVVHRHALNAMHARFELEETVGSELFQEGVVLALRSFGVGEPALVRFEVVAAPSPVPSVTAAAAATSGHDQTGLLHPSQVRPTHG